MISQLLKSVRPKSWKFLCFFPLLCANILGSVFRLISVFDEWQKKIDFQNQYKLLHKMVHRWIQVDFPLSTCACAEGHSCFVPSAFRGLIGSLHHMLVVHLSFSFIHSFILYVLVFGHFVHIHVGNYDLKTCNSKVCISRDIWVERPKELDV